MSEQDWKPIATAPEGELVDTMICDHTGSRNHQKMRRQGRLWFIGNTYVYYQPTHWRPCEQPAYYGD